MGWEKIWGNSASKPTRGRKTLGEKTSKRWGNEDLITTCDEQRIGFLGKIFTGHHGF
jgi:hypothetical protein